MGCGDVRLLRTIGGLDVTGQERAALNKLTMPFLPRPSIAALLHESSLARTMPTDRILTCRYDTTLVGRGRSSD